MQREDALLEKLEACADATEFLQVSTELINLKLKAMLPNAFVQDKLVMEYAVAPLLKDDGPLGTTDVASKLMFAMGKMSKETYADIGLYEHMHGFTSSKAERVSFSDEMVYDFIKNLSILSAQQDSFYLDSINQLKFSFLDAFSKVRYESLIKTVLKLSCDMLLEKIEEEIRQ